MLVHVDWSVCPPWLNWWYCNKDGTEYFCEHEPRQVESQYFYKGLYCEIPENYKYNIDGVSWEKCKLKKP